MSDWTHVWTTLLGDVQATTTDALTLLNDLRRDVAADARLRTPDPADRGGALRELAGPIVPDPDDADRLKALYGDDNLLVNPGSTPAVVRRDAADPSATARLSGPLAGLRPTERYGPFIGDFGDVFFDVYRPEAARVVVVEEKRAAPALVAQQGMAEDVREGAAVLLEKTTLWIRADLFGEGVATETYVALPVRKGEVRIADASVSERGILAPSPLRIRIELLLNPPDPVKPQLGGCDAGAAIRVPTELSLTFDGREWTVRASEEGAAEAYGTEFGFPEPTGRIAWNPDLGRAVIGFAVKRKMWEIDHGTSLIDLQGKADLVQAGLALPSATVPDPQMLSTPQDDLAWLVQVAGWTVRWYEADPHVLGKRAYVLITGRSVSIHATVAPNRTPVEHPYTLWAARDTDHRVPARLTYDRPFQFLYVCDAVGGEHLRADTAEGEMGLDVPLTTSGMPIPFEAGRTTLILTARGKNVQAALLVRRDPDAHDLPHQIALRNALLWVTPAGAVLLSGTLTSLDTIESGRAFAVMGALSWAPTLPDPYVSNFYIVGFTLQRALETPVRTLLMARIEWSSGSHAAVDFAAVLGTPAALVDAPPPSPQPRDRGDVLIPADIVTLAEQGTVTRSPEDRTAWQKARQEYLQVKDDLVTEARTREAEADSRLRSDLREVFDPDADLYLLDVSSAQDWMGVGLDAASPIRALRDSSPAALGPGSGYAVDGLEVTTAARNLRAFTVPQMQWEPVRTLDQDQDLDAIGRMPSPLFSLTDGGPTVVGSASTRLVPVIPEPVVDRIVTAFQEGEDAGMLTTLPFGMKAAVRLRPNRAGGPARGYDLLARTEPAFSTRDLTGGLQITAHAEGGRPDDGGVSPTFQGRTVQLANGADGFGAPLGLSVLSSIAEPASSVETLFNNEFFDDAGNPRVPVTRLDVSGYGGSNFSDWGNPFAFASASKVQFQVLMGRTALEVVKLTNVLHPWGVRITRSVTIERRPGGGVIRRDSGWQAVTPGLFDYRYQDEQGTDHVAPYRFDAGCFRGLYDVRTIRPAPGETVHHRHTTAAGDVESELVPYYFDADLELDGATGRTPVRGALGFLQAKPIGAPAPREAIEALLAQQGPIGGPVDVWMTVGGTASGALSGLPFRATRMEVQQADDNGLPTFTGVVRGMPKLPKTGAWTVLQQHRDAGEAERVSSVRGMPLVRRYPIRYTPGQTPVTHLSDVQDGPPGSTYRFADAPDAYRIYNGALPDREYSFVQATGIHAIQFRSPHIRSSNPAEIAFEERPLLADPFMRAVSKGAFPPPNVAALVPTQHTLQVDGGGLRLTPAIQGWTQPRSNVRLSGGDGTGSYIDYSKATFNLTVDPDAWNATFTKVQMWNEVFGIAPVSGVEMTLEGGSQLRPVAQTVDSLLNPTLEQVLAFLPGFGQRSPIGPVDLGVTNGKHEGKVHVGPPKKKIKVGGVKIKLGVTGGVEFGTEGLMSIAKLEAALQVKMKVAPPFMIVFGLELAIALTSPSAEPHASEKKTKASFELEAYVGFGLDGTIAGYGAYTFIALGAVVVYETPNTFKVGGLIRLEGGLEFPMVAVKLLSEGKGLVFEDPATQTQYCEFTTEVAVHVEICFFLQIKFSYKYKDKKKM